MRRTALLLLSVGLLAIPGTASADFGPIHKPVVAAAPCTAATYDDLLAGSDGDLCEAVDTGAVYRYNVLTGIWWPPDVAPSSVFIAYEADALPTAEGWTCDGNPAFGAVAGGELTIEDTAAGYCSYKITHASISTANNVGMIARIKVTAKDTDATSGNRAQMVLQPTAAGNGGGSITYAGGIGALDAADQVYPLAQASNGAALLTPTISPANSVYQTYYILFFADTQTFRMGALGSVDYGAHISQVTAILGNSAWFGPYSTPRTSTQVFDWVRLFLF
jgi:hypothetical protein